MTLGLNLHVYPSSLVGASRMAKIASSLQQHLAFEESQLVGIHAKGLPAREQISPGVSIVRVQGSSRPGNVGRVLKTLLWQPRVYLRYRKVRVAVVAAHNVWLLPMCARLSRKTGAALAYNAHELETESIAMRGLRQRIARWIESRYIYRAQVVSVVNEPIADWYEVRYGMKRPVVVGNVPVVRPDPGRLREKLRLGEDVMLYIHTGNLVHGRNIPLILDTFAKHANKHVVFLGDGHLRGRVEATAAIHENIHWMAPVPADMIVSNVRDADVGLCLIERQISLSDRLSSPNKLFEALAASTPALCSDLIEARRLFGPLATRWVLNDPATDLNEAIERIGKRDVAEFRASWGGVPSWSNQVLPLVAAYESLALAQ